MTHMSFYVVILTLFILPISGLLKFSSSYKRIASRTTPSILVAAIVKSGVIDSPAAFRSNALFMSSTGKSGGGGSTKLDRKTGKTFGYVCVYAISLSEN